MKKIAWKNSRINGNIMALFFSVCIFLVLAEIILRIIDYPPRDFSPFMRSAETGFKFAPNLDQRMVGFEYNVGFRTNSQGLRNDEIGDRKGYRILFLGDSFTCGYGVEKNEEFTDLLEKRLNVDIINCGVIGFDIPHQVRYYKTQGKLLKPDLVVYAMFLSNDIIGCLKWETDPNGAFISKTGYSPVFITTRIKLLNLLKAFIYTYRIRHLPISDWVPYPEHLEICRKELSPSARDTYERAKVLIRGLRDEVEASGADLLVVMFSDRNVVEDEANLKYRAKTADFDRIYELDQPERIMSTYLSDIGVKHVDLNPMLKDYYKKDGRPLYYRLDGHLTVLGHKVVADILYPILKEKISDAKR